MNKSSGCWDSILTLRLPAGWGGADGFVLMSEEAGTLTTYRWNLIIGNGGIVKREASRSSLIPSAKGGRERQRREAGRPSNKQETCLTSATPTRVWSLRTGLPLVRL